MAYRYLALSSDGKESRWVLDVASEEAAERMLWQRELTILDLERVRRRVDLVSVFPSVLGPRPRDVILFSRQLATLVDSGVALTAALQLLTSQVSSKYLRRVIGEIEDDIHMGTSLSAAMAKHPVAFSDLYCRMIETGERSGNLGPSLRQLAELSSCSSSTGIRCTRWRNSAAGLAYRYLPMFGWRGAVSSHVVWLVRYQ